MMLQRWLESAIALLRRPWSIFVEAQRLVEAHRIQSLEGIEAVAADLGFPVAYVDFPSHVSGLVIAWQDQSSVITINRHRPLLHQRYTIAHELGHCLFHVKAEARPFKWHADLQADCFAFTCLVQSLRSEREIIPFVLQDFHIAWSVIHVVFYAEMAKRLHRLADWLSGWLVPPSPQGV